ncbi:hypothetical protein AHiyo4_50130 [Arthrobacter sp. Hiyo4]|nr:hypothetical protein AHiyo4_50130 [Arthrobacter sp. Hiyo4]
MVVAPGATLLLADGLGVGAQHPSHSGSVSAATVAISFPALRLPAMSAPRSIPECFPCIKRYGGPSALKMPARYRLEQDLVTRTGVSAGPLTAR